MKLRDNSGLRLELIAMVHARDQHGGKSRFDLVDAILDAVDRALTGPSPSPPTCKQSLQVGPGTATTEGNET